MKEETENNKQEINAEMKDIKETLKTLTEFMMDQANISKSSSAQKDTSTPHNLPPWYRLTRGIHHWKGGTLNKFVACGPSNMRSAHQNSMSSSSR